MSKKIIIREDQIRFIIGEDQSIATYNGILDPKKVAIVKNFLDDNFVKTSKDTTNGLDGLNTASHDVVIMKKDLNKKNVLSYSSKSLVDKLKSIYRNMFSDDKECTDFFNRIVVAWYYDRIPENGIVS